MRNVLRLRLFRFGLVPIVAFLPSGFCVGSPITIDFESFSDGTVLSSEVPGIAFDHAAVATAGISLNEFEFPPKSGFNVIFDSGGPIEMIFLLPTKTFHSFFTYRVPLKLEAYDSADGLVATINSAFGDNRALSGEAGSSPNELLKVAHLAGIKRVVMTGDALGTSFVTDDLSYDSAVPEPSPLFPTLVAMAVIARSVRRKRT